MFIHINCFLRSLFFFCLVLSISNYTIAQEEEDIQEIFTNYGSTTGAISQYYFSSFTVGQPVVGNYFGRDYQGAVGFWSRYLVSPGAPLATASEGDYPDRILLNWEVDPLSPISDFGFKIYRDGSFLAEVDASTTEFLDFNVIPGVFYDYEVRGVNYFGVGYPAKVVGFVNPNGLVTGQITTLNNNPVEGVQVTLEPSIGNSLNFDGQNDYVEIPFHQDFVAERITTSFWVKRNTSDEQVIVDLGQNQNRNWWVNNSGQGIKIGIGSGSTAQEFEVAIDQSFDEWQHICFTFNGSDLNAYLNGELEGTKAMTMGTIESNLFLAAHPENNQSNFDGYIDDFRIYNRQLSQTEIIRTMNATIPSDTDGLVAYWKFDEGLGYKVFDLGANQLDGFVYGALFSEERPNVLNAGLTDDSGHYLIDGINYGGGQSFTARPSKNFEFNNALEFNATDQQFASISGFEPRDTGAIQIWFKPSALSGMQTIIDRPGYFQLRLDGQELELLWGGADILSLGTIDKTDYLHLNINYSSNSSQNVEVFINGLNPQIFSASSISSWGEDIWYLGKRADDSQYYTGLIDEVVFYSQKRSQNEILADLTGVDTKNLNLSSHFSLNESVGTEISDQGPNNVGSGTIHGASWSNISANPERASHLFNPGSRIVTLNKSNTSVDNVDFIDESTVTASGFVRYADTECFSERVEILVNGKSHVPPIYSDDKGFFVGDFEPGSTFTLSPFLEGHDFSPRFWDIENIVVPKGGLIFNDGLTRKLSVDLVGGLCEKSIVGSDQQAFIEIESTNGCYSREIELVPGGKKAVFKKLPPLTYNVVVKYHSIGAIYQYFSNDGRQIDLSQEDGEIKFLYRTEPKIETSELPVNECGDPMMEQFLSYQLVIKAYEEYGDQVCYLDSMHLNIRNEISGIADIDVSYGDGYYLHKFNAGAPKITGDHYKGITYTVSDPFASSRDATKTVEAIVVGKRRVGETFITGSPDIPMMILRDPPGDQSYSYLESGETLCNLMSMSMQKDLSIEQKTSISLGPDFEIPTSPATATQVDVTADISLGISATSSYTSESEQEVCLTATNILQTSADELIVGGDMGADLYMGAAMNFELGKIDELVYDSTECNYNIVSEPYVKPDGFSTQYIYSEFQLINETIPELLATQTKRDSISADMWQQIIDYNLQLKKSAVNVNNISFDNGVIYENREGSSITNSLNLDFELILDTEVALAAGVTVGGVGAVNEVAVGMTLTQGKSTQSSTTIQNEVGYHLEDNDPGDFFSVDINQDDIYGTPVFKLKSGQSSCPHEPNTLYRDMPGISVENPVQINVPESEPAIFKLELSNDSPSQDTRLYHLWVDPETNPFGAELKVNGQAINELEYQLSYLETAEVTVTMHKGPTVFDYENIGIHLYSKCEISSYAYSLEVDPVFDQYVELSAHFIPSCSDVEITYPQSGWVITPSDEEKLSITLGEYNLNDEEFETIKMQYRPVVGNGIWITFQEIPKDSLGDIFEVVSWNVAELSDGPYELRATSKCNGGVPAGLSSVIPGMLEREAPELFGLPQPADGVLELSDQIYIEFTEEIDCTDLTTLPGALTDYVGLINANSGEPITNISISCLENKIYILPNDANSFIENKLLRAEVRGIRDLVGNTSDHITWDFFVDRNPLKWVEGNIDDVKYEGDTWILTRTIQNYGGRTEDFTLEDVPTWITPSVLSGSIEPGGHALVVFSVPDDIANGTYEGSLFLKGVSGEEPLRINLDVLCQPPSLDLNPTFYEFSMPFTVELNIEEEISNDENDWVAAYVDNQLRGLANVEYEPNLNRYLAFVNVYSNTEAGEQVEFRIWDASDCLLYGTVLPNFIFDSNEEQGTPDAPIRLNTQGIILSKIPISEGWNWISFNLDMPDKSIDAVLSSIEQPMDLFIKGQSLFSSYHDESSSWLGSLQKLGYLDMYQIKGTQEDTISLQGYLIDSESTNISIKKGWNWIGYIPQQGMSVDDALASLNPLPGDIIKGQHSFAQYVNGLGWIGSLIYMEAPNGYMLKSSSESVLNFPKPLVGTNNDRRFVSEQMEAQKLLKIWGVNPADFEFSMTMTAIVSENQNNLLDEGDQIAAFYKNEVRGVAQTVYLDVLDKHLLFMTSYGGNQPNERLNFKYYDSSDEMIYELNETFDFIPNLNFGSIDLPEILTIESSSSVLDLTNPYFFRVQPNPFDEEAIVQLNLNSEMYKEDKVTLRVLDLFGRVVKEQELSLHSTKGEFMVNSRDQKGNELSPGVYYISIKGSKGGFTEKVVIH